LGRNGYRHLPRLRLDERRKREDRGEAETGEDGDDNEKPEQGRHGCLFVLDSRTPCMDRKGKSPLDRCGASCACDRGWLCVLGRGMNEMSRVSPLAEAGERDPGRRAGDHPIRAKLGGRSIVLVGLMGAGKSTVGRRLAQRLGLPFLDADHEIEVAAGMTIPDIFSIYGEPYFRDGERRVIARLLQDGPIVLATGGGAFMSEETRTHIAATGISIWLKADVEVLMRRVRKRQNRPLLQNTDPEGTMRRLMAVRHPIYGKADLTVESHEAPHDRVVAEILKALARRFGSGEETAR
jgi:shikimate kinase